MHAEATRAAVMKEVFVVLMAVMIWLDQAEDVPAAADVALKTPPAMAAGVANAPIAASFILVKSAVGAERVPTH